MPLHCAVILEENQFIVIYCTKLTKSLLLFSIVTIHKTEGVRL